MTKANPLSWFFCLSLTADGIILLNCAGVYGFRSGVRSSTRSESSFLPLAFRLLAVAGTWDDDAAGAVDDEAVPVVACLGGELDEPAVVFCPFAIDGTYQPQE